MYVCVCNAVNERQLLQAVAAGNTSIPALRACLGFGTCCGKCNRLMRDLVKTQLQTIPSTDQEMHHAER